MAYNIEQRDEQLVGTKAAITYTLEFDRAPQHLVRITLRVENINADKIVLVVPAWSPGSYKIRDYAGHVGNVKCKNDHHWIDLNKLEIDTNGQKEIEIEYLVYGHERTVRTNHINRNHAFIQPPATLMFVEGRTNEVHHVLLKHDSNAWPNVSTALSPVSTSNGVLLGALNYDILADSPIEIGNHQVRKFDVDGSRHELALASIQQLDADWLAEQLKHIVQTEKQMFGGLPYDRYVFIVHAFAGAGGGLEHSRSSVNATDPIALLEKSKAIGFLSLLCHEFFHLWNVKRIRPVELGPFNYTQPVLTPMLWLAEGFTSYFDDLITFRCGFFTEKEYLDNLATDHFGKLARVPGRFEMSVRDSSRLAWLKLYMQSPDGMNRFPSYYLKGGIVFLLTDLYIIDHTDGKKSLSDGLKELWSRYKQDPGTGMTEEECIAIIERATTVQLRERLMSWLDDKTELPYNEILSKVGLELREAPKDLDAITIGEKRSFAAVPYNVFCGWTCADVSGKVIVKTVEDGSPAQMAGIGIDDEIVAVDGIRISSVSHLDRIVADVKQPNVPMVCQCDGVMYETVLVPTPQKAFTLKFKTDLSERQQKLKSKWLERNI